MNTTNTSRRRLPFQGMPLGVLLCMILIALLIEWRFYGALLWQSKVPILIALAVSLLRKAPEV